MTKHSFFIPCTCTWIWLLVPCLNVGIMLQSISQQLYSEQNTFTSMMWIPVFTYNSYTVKIWKRVSGLNTTGLIQTLNRLCVIYKRKHETFLTWKTSDEYRKHITRKISIAWLLFLKVECVTIQHHTPLDHIQVSRMSRIFVFDFLIRN